MFEHLKKNIARRTFSDMATWRPAYWNSPTGQKPPELTIIRLTDQNLRFARAALNPRFPKVVNRREGKLQQQDLEVRRERHILLAIAGGVVGWANVPDENGKELPFPSIGEEPNDPGLNAVRALLRALGHDEENDFLSFCYDSDSWLMDDIIDVSEATGVAPVVPLEKRSLPG